MVEIFPVAWSAVNFVQGQYLYSFKRPAGFDIEGQTPTLPLCLLDIPLLAIEEL